MRKGAYIVELAILTPIILTITFIFFSLINSFNRQMELENVFYETVFEFKGDLYLYNKILENSDLKNISNNNIIFNKINKFTINQIFLNKIYEKLKNNKNVNSKEEIIKYYKLKTEPILIIKAYKDEIDLKCIYNLKNITISSIFENYKFSVEAKIKQYDIGKFLINIGDYNNSNDNFYNKIYITKNGILNTKVYHIYNDCMGMKLAKYIKEQKYNWINAKSIEIEGETFDMCIFCKMKID